MGERNRCGQAFSMTHGNATNGSVPWVGENIEPDKGYWIAHSIQYRGGPGTIDIDHPWLAAKDYPRVQPVNCSCAPPHHPSTRTLLWLRRSPSPLCRCLPC